MKIFVKILIWASFTLILYVSIYNLIIYLDPGHPNILGLKVISSFTVMFPSYFIGSYLSKK